MELFKDVMKSIMETKEDLTNDLELEKVYVPFIVNRSLSYHYDCIFYANEMNLYSSSLEKKLQYHFFINTIRGYKRPFKKWQKLEKIDDLDVIKEYYGYSNERAKEALTLLTDAQINEIKNKLNRGGLNGSNHKRGRTGRSSSGKSR